VGVRGHALIFTLIMAFLFSTAYAAQFLGPSQAWTLIFIIGASFAGTYLVMTALAILERTRKLLLQSEMKIRVIIVATTFGSILAGLNFWVGQAGSVEALPIFPAFIIIFYGWILLQSYFIATPVSHLLARAEHAITGDENRKKAVRTIGTIALFIPVLPLLYGIWAVSSWSSTEYQNIQGSPTEILVWTILVTLTLLFTYFIMLRWSWRSIRRAPQSAVFIGGLFLVLWGYLLYKGASMLMGYVTQSQPSNPIVDSALVLVSIIGAMQSLAGKLSKKSGRHWGQVLPFLVFSFGSVYAVAQFYFILQFAITRVELSILVNATVFATGLVIMMLMIRRHILTAGSPSLPVQFIARDAMDQPRPTIVKRSIFHLLWKKSEGATEQTEGSPAQEETREDSDDTAT
jgi:hypothetical protein